MATPLSQNPRHVDDLLMKKTLLSCLCLLFSIAFVRAQTYEYKNGFWYNGSDFTKGTWYVVKGAFSKKAPSTIDSVIDLQERWVVPPIGDAYCSSLADNPSAANALKMYLEEGAFYLQVLGNTLEGRANARQLLSSKPGMPDAVFANGGITCSLGYPFLKYEGPAQGVRNLKAQVDQYGEIREQRKMMGDGYWFIDNKDSLNKIWSKIKEQKPDIISIYLLDSDKNGGKEGKGLDPETAKLVAKKARKSGMRVYAHVETVDDVRLALKIGADGIANLPGHDWDGKGDPAKFELSDADLKLLAKKKTVVIPLFSHGQSAADRASVQAFQVKTFVRLLENGVNLVLGSDDMQRTTRSELNYWFTLGNIDNPKVLKVLCENTPRAIYPKRKIGKIEDGYEASFIVLDDNPLNNILKLRLSSFKVKNGKILK